MIPHKNGSFAFSHSFTPQPPVWAPTTPLSTCSNQVCTVDLDHTKEHLAWQTGCHCQETCCWSSIQLLISCLSQQYSDLHLSPTAPTLLLPSVSPIGALSAYQYTPLASLNLPAILAFSLLSTLLPTDPLLLSGSTTPPNYPGPNHPFTNVCYPLISSHNDCGHY